ncbi:hypothetical protein LCGC14_2468460 [marine sediment metagenome]|uniref:Uncharacterized protein n=1 Tax=marine sediment metagenome TaxID=412755 RepID=A0A0F9BBP6_9ZZZZ
MSEFDHEARKAMEAVMSKIGDHFGVQPGDVDGLFAAIEARSAELAAFDDLKVCDCCEGLFEHVTSGDHNQCDTCTELANLTAEASIIKSAARELLADDMADTCPECLIGESDARKNLALLVADTPEKGPATDG